MPTTSLVGPDYMYHSHSSYPNCPSVPIVGAAQTPSMAMGNKLFDFIVQQRHQQQQCCCPQLDPLLDLLGSRSSGTCTSRGPLAAADFVGECWPLHDSSPLNPSHHHHHRWTTAAKGKANIKMVFDVLLLHAFDPDCALLLLTDPLECSHILQQFVLPMVRESILALAFSAEVPPGTTGAHEHTMTSTVQDELREIVDAYLPLAGSTANKETYQQQQQQQHSEHHRPGAARIDATVVLSLSRLPSIVELANVAQLSPPGSFPLPTTTTTNNNSTAENTNCRQPSSLCDGGGCFSFAHQPTSVSPARVGQRRGWAQLLNFAQSWDDNRQQYRYSNSPPPLAANGPLQNQQCRWLKVRGTVISTTCQQGVVDGEATAVVGGYRYLLQLEASPMMISDSGTTSSSSTATDGTYSKLSSNSNDPRLLTAIGEHILPVEVVDPFFLGVPTGGGHDEHGGTSSTTPTTIIAVGETIECVGYILLSSALGSTPGPAAGPAPSSSFSAGVGRGGGGRKTGRRGEDADSIDGRPPPGYKRPSSASSSYHDWKANRAQAATARALGASPLGMSLTFIATNCTRCSTSQREVAAGGQMPMEQHGPNSGEPPAGIGTAFYTPPSAGVLASLEGPPRPPDMLVDGGFTINPFVDLEQSPEGLDSVFWRAYRMWSASPSSSPSSCPPPSSSRGTDCTVGSSPFGAFFGRTARAILPLPARLAIRLALLSTLVSPGSNGALKLLLVSPADEQFRTIRSEVTLGGAWQRTVTLHAAAEPTQALFPSSKSTTVTGTEVKAGKFSIADGQCLFVPSVDLLTRQSVSALGELFITRSLCLGPGHSSGGINGLGGGGGGAGSSSGEALCECPLRVSVVGCLSTQGKATLPTEECYAALLRRSDVVFSITPPNTSTQIMAMQGVFGEPEDEEEERRRDGDDSSALSPADRWSILCDLGRQKGSWAPAPQLSKGACNLVQDYYVHTRQQIPSTPPTLIETLVRLAAAHAFLTATDEQLHQAFRVPLAVGLVDAVVAVALCDRSLFAQYGQCSLGGVDLFACCSSSSSSSSAPPPDFRLSDFADQLSAYLRSSIAPFSGGQL